MHTKTWLAGLMAAAATGAIASAVWAQESTTVIRHHTETVVPVHTDAVDATVTRKTVTVHRAATRRLVSHRVVRHRRPTRTLRAAHYDSRSTDTRVMTSETPEPATATVTTDRKTVIHRDDEGNVVRHTKVVRTDPEGNKDVTVRHSVDGPDAPPPHEDAPHTFFY